MKVTRFGDVLVIRETPGIIWIAGVFFGLIGGTFVYGSLGGFNNLNEVPTYAVYLSLLIGSAGVAAGLWMVFRAPATTVLVDRNAGSVVLTRKGLAGNSETIFSFAEIRGFRLVEAVDSEGEPIWSLGLELVDGETIKISSLDSHDEKFKRDFVFETNEFLQKQMPSYRTTDLMNGEG